MITILCGKSASGKDTLLNALQADFGFGSIVTATSRPIREGEADGREYHFMTKEQFKEGVKKGDFLEHRVYHTLVEGKADDWYYGCPKRALDELDVDKDYVVILDMQGTKNFVDYYGEDNCFVCFVDAPEEIRKERAMSRGSFDETEWNRRAEDDEVKFSKEIREGIVNGMLYNKDISLQTLTKSFLLGLDNYKMEIEAEKLTERE